MNKQRPLSPHLSIYKIQITSALSIMHRVSGIVLFFGLIFISLVMLYDWYHPNSPYSQSGSMCSVFCHLFLFSWSLALFYHLCNGIRYLFWEKGIGFDNDTVTKSGIAVLCAAAVLTILCWMIGLRMI